MAFHRTSLATVTQAMFNYLDSHGFDAADMCARAGIKTDNIYDSNARIPVYATERLWDIAIRETGRPCLVYDVVYYLEPGMLHAVGHAWVVSQTLKEALQRFIRYHRMVSTNVEMKLEQAQGTWQLIANMIEEAPLYPTIVLAFGLEMCRESFGDDLVPLHVRLSRSQPEDASSIEKFYRCPIDYDCSENVLVFKPEDLTRKLRGANVEVAAAMETVIANYLHRMDAKDVSSQVRKIIAELLPQGVPSKQEIAENLNMTPRTLQRRLETQNSSVKEIMDQTRHHLAKEFLSQGHSIKWVAFNIGFSDSSNFSRAFKRWEGKTPKQFKL